MTIKFIGAAREVTGSKHLLCVGGKRILLDCGMFQGKGLETDAMNRNLGFEPASIDHIILSHAHIDHSGLIPYLYKGGFRGSVICTTATRDLCAIMLPDSAHIQESDVQHFNEKRAKKGLPPIEPLYKISDAEECLKLFISIAYDRRFYISDSLNVKFTNTGHLLGSAAVNLTTVENGQKTHITYTGDIGRRSDNILPPPSPFPQCDYLIAESTYGNRLHPAESETAEALLQIVVETCVVQRGKLIIPSFAIGRTQEIVYILNNLHNDGKLPKIDVYVDSPLSVNATEIFRMHIDGMNENVKSVLKYDRDPFGFNSLHYIKDVEDSKALNNSTKPCIIIAASGMLEAGRVKHHVANNISDDRNTILIVGYCTPSSLGARIQQPDIQKISIFGKEHIVRARIAKMDALSGHGDYLEMQEFLKCQVPALVKKVFLVHGEYTSQQEYAKKLQVSGFENIEIPSAGTEFTL